MRTLTLATGADGIAIITIDLPGRPVNVFTAEFIRDLDQAVDQVLQSGPIKGAVITSAKRSFIAGADLKELVDLFDRGMTAEAAAAQFRPALDVMRKIETGGKPFVAAINGHALGGGLELCLACHYRMAADHPGTRIGLPEVNVGLLPGGGGTQRLARLIGIQKALPLLLSGAPVNPAEALAQGIIGAVVPEDQLLDSARRWALEHPVAQQPWDVKGYKVPGGAGALAPHANQSFSVGMAGVRSRTQDNYPAPLAILSAVYDGTQLPLERGLQVEAKYFGTLLVSPVARNLIRTMFINKGRCDKLHGRPPEVPKSAVKRLGVIGAGMMGAGIAYAAAGAGIDVVLLDNDQNLADKGKAYSANLVAKEVEKKRCSDKDGEALLGRITPTTDYALLAACDLVIEAVFESRPVKADVFGRITHVLGEHAFVASNTSTLPISSLAPSCGRPADVIGLHFFSPVERMPLVEVIIGQETSAPTRARALDFVEQLKKTPIVVNDSPGFFTTRLFCAYIDEAMAMVEEGVNPALIENAARMSGMATGPLAVVDEVSLDLQQKVIDQAIADGLPEQFLRTHAQRVVQTMNRIGRTGRKSGGGFYDFPSAGKKHLWPGLAYHFPVKPEQPSLSDVQKRLMSIQALEAARCIEEGVITEAMHADVGSILGLGFPTWTGGAISFIETVGIANFVDDCRDLARRYGTRFMPSNWLVQRSQSKQGFYAAASDALEHAA